MKRCIRFISIIATLLFLVILVNASSNQSPILCGTLVVTLPTKEGLLICADKRVGNKKGKYSDTYTKIQPIGEKALFFNIGAFATGDPDSITSESHPSHEFNLNRTIKTFFQTNNPNNIEAYWDAIKSILNFEVLKFKEKFRTDLSSVKEPTVLFHTVFMYLDKSNRLKGGRYLCGYTKTNDFDFSYTLEGYVIEDNELAIGVIKPYGELETFNKINVNTYQQENDLNKLKKIIKVASNLSSDISSKCDCVMLSYRDGFIWKETNTEYQDQKPVGGCTPARLSLALYSLSNERDKPLK